MFAAATIAALMVFKTFTGCCGSCPDLSAVRLSRVKVFPNMKNQFGWHGSPLDRERFEQALSGQEV